MRAGIIKNSVCIVSHHKTRSCRLLSACTRVYVCGAVAVVNVFLIYMSAGRQRRPIGGIEFMKKENWYSSKVVV